MSSFFVRKPVRKKKHPTPFGSKAPASESHTARFKINFNHGFVRGETLILSVWHVEQGITKVDGDRFMTFIAGQYRFTLQCDWLSTTGRRTSIRIMVNGELRGVLELPFEMKHKYVANKYEPYKSESYVHMSAGDSFWFTGDVSSELGASSAVFLLNPEIHVDVLRVTSF